MVFRGAIRNCGRQGIHCNPKRNAGSMGSRLKLARRLTATSGPRSLASVPSSAAFARRTFTHVGVSPNASDTAGRADSGTRESVTSIGECMRLDLFQNANSQMQSAAEIHHHVDPTLIAGVKFSQRDDRVRTQT